MNSEELRFQSFNGWPPTTHVCARKLSANGFFATNFLEIECYWCHCRISNWKCSDDIEQRHIELNPQCQFVINRHTCGNLPLAITSNEFQAVREQHEVGVSEIPIVKVQSTIDLHTEKARLATFVNWPNPNITPQSLAKAGFFYRNRSDEVECAWCKGVIAKWEKQDNAFEEHRRFFPECPRVILGPLIEIADDEIRDLCIQQILPPKNPKYTSLHSRLQTYSSWPIPDIQRPEDLAQAGLYYQNVDDQVKCFHCNMGLRSWEKKDDPWFEHAKWYPRCEFVRLVKGVSYIEEVQKVTRNVQTSEVAPMTIDDAMLTEPVKLALEMGVNTDVLRKKTQQQILQAGRPYETVDDLLKAIFDEQENIDSDLQNTLQTTNMSNCQSLNQISQNVDLNSHDRRNNEIISDDIHESNINLEHVEACSSKYTSATNTKIRAVASANNIKPNQIDNSLQRVEINEKLASDQKFLEEENRKLKDARLCKVCLDEEVGVVYLPCGHLVTCVQCAPGVNQCPLCRTTIKGFVRTYLS